MPEILIEEQRGLRLLLLRGQNVYTYREYFELPLDEQGLVYVTGHNLDTQEPSSSGAGKSRLFSLIPRALYGRESLGKSEAVSAIWPADGSGGFYELLYWSDGTYYKVREEAGRKSASILSFFRNSSLDDASWEPIGAKNKKGVLQAEIAASTNRPLDEFLGTVVWKQGHGHVLIQGTPSERITWLSSLFGLTKYDMIHAELDSSYEVLKAKQQDYLPFVGAYTQAKQTFDTLGDLVELTNNLSVSKQSLELLQQKEQDISVQLQTATDALVSCRESARTRAQFLALGVSLDTGFSDAKATIKQSQHVLSESLSEKSTLAQLKTSFDTAKSTISSYNALPSEIKSALDDSELLNRLVSEISNLRVLRSELQAKLVLVEQNVTQRDALVNSLRSLYGNLLNYGSQQSDLISSDAAANALTSVRATYTEILGATAVLESKVAEFQRLSLLGGACPTCGSTLDAKHVQSELLRIRPLLVDAKQRQNLIVQHEKALSSYVSYMCNLDKLPTSPASDRESLKANLSACLADLTQRESLYQSIQQAKSVSDKYHMLSNEVLTFNALSTQNRLDSLQLIIDNATQAQQRAYVVLSYAEKDLSKTDQDILHYEEDVSLLRSTLNQISSDKMHLVSDINLTEHKVAQLESARIELDRLATLNDAYLDSVRRFNLTRDVRSAYDKKGFKKAKLRQLLELIREKLPVWTSILFTERNFFVDVAGDDDQLNLVAHQISDPLGDGHLVEKVYDVAELSGGEESKLAICIMLTLIDIVAEERKCNIAILDEVDRHMDKNALALMSNHLIRNLAVRRSSIFFVSHQIPLSSDFDKELLITKQRACSTLKLKNLRTA